MICPKCKKIDAIVFDELEINGKCNQCGHEITLISNKIQKDIEEIKMVLISLNKKIEELEKKLFEDLGKKF